MGKGNATAFMSKQRKRIANVRFTIKFSNYLLMAVLQALLAVCRGINENSKNLNSLSGWREHIWMINF